MSSDPTITVAVNGESKAVPAGTTVLKLLEFLQLDAARLAIELNRSILKRSEWDSRFLDDGDALEIVEFVGGGR